MVVCTLFGAVAVVSAVVAVDGVLELHTIYVKKMVHESGDIYVHYWLFAYAVHRQPTVHIGCLFCSPTLHK